tara:strand:+ start:49 stop:555 length:507 start_codon:yes stop_codon:yes gene_type:complete
MIQVSHQKTIHGYKVEDLIISRIKKFIDEKIYESYLEPYNRNDMLTLSNNFKKKTYEYVLIRIKQFESYKNIYQPYIDMSYETLITVKRSYYIYVDNLSLLSKIEELKQNNYIKNKTTICAPLISTTLVFTATFDMSYVKYIDKYGAPEGGIFHPKKLAEFLTDAVGN